MEEKFDWEEHGLMSDKELDEIDANFKRTEVEGVQNILKYFDRIHDKLFTFNNILIGGYFVLSQIYDSFSIYGIIIPLINLAILLFIEYRMMEKSRFEADVRKKTQEEIETHGISINKTNFYSLITFLTTAIVVGIFIFNLFTISEKIPKPEVKVESIQTEKENEKKEILVTFDHIKIDSVTYWYADYDDKTKTEIIIKGLLVDKTLRDSKKIISELNTGQNTKIVYIKESNDTLYVKLTNEYSLTEQSGTTGAWWYLAGVTFTLTETEDINFINYDFEEGSHLSPGIYNRDKFNDLKIITTPQQHL